MGRCKKEVHKRFDRTLLLEKLKRDKDCNDSGAGKQAEKDQSLIHGFERPPHTGPHYCLWKERGRLLRPQVTPICVISRQSEALASH
jgi:hypothetical protein